MVWLFFLDPERKSDVRATVSTWSCAVQACSMACKEDNEKEEQTRNHFWWIIHNLHTPLTILSACADIVLVFQKTHVVLGWASPLQYCSTRVLAWEFIYSIDLVWCSSLWHSSTHKHVGSNYSVLFRCEWASIALNTR